MALTVSCTGTVNTVDSSAIDLVAAYEAATEDPWDDQKLESLLSFFPSINGYYLVEGDLLMTRREVRQTLLDVSVEREEPIATFSPGELIVMTENGVPQYYRDIEDRNLSYAIDATSFESAADGAYGAVTAAMVSATADWQNLCPECRIQFSLTDQPNPAEGSVWFIVKYVDALFIDGKLAPIASAFFPNHQVSRRYVYIFPRYFITGYDSVGVIRHELGHVLGYRHEHTRKIRACNFEDDEWAALTPYDPHSVMHYVCGDAGNYELEFTQSDIEGHKDLYRLNVEGS